MDGGVKLLCCLVGLVLTGIVISAYDNIALGKRAWQENPFVVELNGKGQVWGADKAVDGQFTDRSAVGGQCTISDNGKQTAIWWVDLGRVLRIHHITIYYRTDNIRWDSTNGYTARFLGFSVYISNTTNRYEGTLCFKDKNYTRATIPNVTTIECVNYGRYVIYYNERFSGVTYPYEYSRYAHNELCEFEVYGCPESGVYGENCNIPCPQNCQESHCNIVDGTCLGCVVGYKGSRCEEECDGRTYGQDCVFSCGSCFNFEQCHHSNGSCLKGCDRGFQGEKCTEECPEGRYGFNCQNTCNINCGASERCDRVKGQCEGGCQEGWKDLKCDKKCDGGKFGLNCNQSCGVCFGKEQCDHINGTCPNGCDRGYQGIYCTQACPEGSFDFNCSKRCSITCRVSERCDVVTGRCNGGCKNGWQGDRCEQYRDPNTQCCSFLYGVLSVLSLSVISNMFFIFRFLRNGMHKGQNHQEKSSAHLSTEHTTPNTEIYDKVEDNPGYQELGQLSQPSHYDQLH